VAKRSPILGYNHNVRYRGLVFHVQTEDSGVLSPHLFTHLFYGGTIISTRKLVYDAGSAEDAIKALMQAQHKAVMKDLKNGSFDDKIDQYLAGTEGLEPRSATAPTKVPRASTPLPDEDRTERATTDVDSATIEAVHASVSRAADDDLTTPIELSLEPGVGHAPTVQVHAPTLEMQHPPDTEPIAKPRTKTADRGSRGSSVRFKQPGQPLEPPPPPELDDSPTLSDSGASSVAAAVQAANRGTMQGRAPQGPPPVPSRTATPPPIPQKSTRPTLDSSPEISIEIDDDSDRVRSPRDTAVENPYEAGSLESDGVPRSADRSRNASQSAATLPPAKKPSRPAISPPAVMSRPITNADDKSGAVEIYAPAPASVEPPPGERREGERPGQYSMNRQRPTDAPRREPTGKMAAISNPNAIPSGLGRPRSPSGDRPPTGQVRVPQPPQASAVPQAIGKEGSPGDPRGRGPNVTAPISNRTGAQSSGVVMTRPAVIVGAPAKGAPQTPPKVRKAREDEGRGFGQGLISEKSLDEVILAYLSEDSEDK